MKKEISRTSHESKEFSNSRVSRFILGLIQFSSGSKKSTAVSSSSSSICIHQLILTAREDRSQIGQKGYTRVVYCNDHDNPEAVQLNYRGNYVSTTKYTAVNFLPKSLFEQFRRVANIYFLVVACVSFSPLAPYSALSVLAPLLVVIGATMAKEAVEDWRRRKQSVPFKTPDTVSVTNKEESYYCKKMLDLECGP
ncbi:putative phospholipid-transporting ATPase 8 [Vitis vinifera]|uniref:Putative phospholipid-transporting ATPase 8 n=1 Tax=Vitis vinifera TaxID=29760 RepID=A0A438EFY1_VITVI|nr:putative phospholipid-transporting ATPase 8 [Vitis vinifera]